MSRGEHEQARERLQEVVDMGRPGLAIPALTAWAQSEHEQGSRERAVRAADELVELLRAHPDLPRRTMATARITAATGRVRSRAMSTRRPQSSTTSRA